MELLVIGFDGADYELMQKFVDKGKMPNLKKLMESGVYGELKSTEIPITPCAWTSFMTGKNPGKHGIFDFTRPTREGLEVVSFSDVEDDTIFDILSEDYGIGTLNIPATYPPGDINGFMVSGMMTPSLEKASNDEEVVEIIKEESYEIEVPVTYNGGNEEKLLDACYETLDKRRKTALRLVEEKDPGVFMPVFTVGDRISHWFWKYMDPEHPEFEESDYEKEVEKIYSEIDEAIGELVEKAGNANIAVMSDHGFTGVYQGINLNKLFMDHDLLELKRNPLTKARYLAFRAGFTLENVYKLVKKLGMESAVKKVADSPDRDWMRKILSLPFLSLRDVDFERSRAYSAMHFGPVFLVDEDTRPRVKQLLEDLEYRGEKIMENVIDGEEIFHGKRSEEAPDIVYQTEGMHYQAHRYFEFGSNKVFTQPFNTESGHHRLEGIFVASGPDVEEKGEIEGASITDVAPTLLTLLGKKVPGDMDGEPLQISEKDVEVDEAVITDF